MRGDWFDSTGRLWINPSPNMRSLNEATLYPGIGMIEATNISVGRGTDTPFELLGAPWINEAESVHLARYLNAVSYTHLDVYKRQVIRFGAVGKARRQSPRNGTIDRLCSVWIASWSFPSRST